MDWQLMIIDEILTSQAVHEQAQEGNTSSSMVSFEIHAPVHGEVS